LVFALSSSFVGSWGGVGLFALGLFSVQLFLVSALDLFGVEHFFSRVIDLFFQLLDESLDIILLTLSEFDN
jgi:hypothetical protein